MPISIGENSVAMKYHQQQYNRLSDGGNCRRKRDPRSGAEFHVDVDAILSGSTHSLL